MWNWYEWNSQEDFDTWHNNLMTTLGYPLDTQPPTTAYTGSRLVQGKWIGIVEESKAQGLTLTTLRPPLPEAAFTTSDEA